MKTRYRTLAPLLVAAGLLSGCAVGSTVSPTRSMPAARAALAPEFRIFYDTLVEYGDWVLIEPVGYLFRPRVDFHTWRPYEEGFWAPSSSYGWVWISSEPFGWATYHYGQWFYDEMRGWVWKPGAEWGPAWVSWRANDRYVGWSPMSPGGGVSPRAPGGPYVFVAMDQMGSSDLTLYRGAELGKAVSDAKPANNEALVEGVEMPLGPSFERIERARGRPLPRVSIADVIDKDRVPATGGKVKSSSPAPAPFPAPIDETKRAGEEAARDARALLGSRADLPSRIAVVRPVVGAPPTRAPAKRDTTGAR